MYEKEERDRFVALAPWNQHLHRDGSHLSKHFQHLMTLSDSKASLESCQWSTHAYFLSGARGWDGPRAAFAHDSGAAYRDIRCPTLLLSNADEENADDLMAERILAVRPDFEYHKFQGSDYSHTSMIYDDPQPWVDGIAAFVKKHG